MSSPKSAQKAKPAASVVWFEIPADNPARAQAFYKKLFGWKVNPIPGMEDYWHIDTSGPDAAPDGGLMRRKHKTQSITNYIGVASVTRFAAKVVKLGGTVCVPKTAVPGMGFFAICRDSENNEFALWEMTPKAK